MKGQFSQTGILMSVLLLILVILEWTVIAGGVVGGGFALAELANARTKTGKIKEEKRNSAWRTILLYGFLILGACSHLLHGITSWLLLGLSLCLLCAFLTMEVRSVRTS